VIFDEKKLGSS
ncbi:hypothetical protein Tco_0391757, partial [Tanacetum coccineum]